MDQFSHQGQHNGVTRLKPPGSARIHLPADVSFPSAIALLVAFVLLVLAVAHFVPVGVDWRLAIRPAALALLSGHSPYSVERYLNAPWTLIPLIPIALLPPSLGWGVFTVCALCIMAWLAIRHGAGPLGFAAFLLSPPVIHGLLNGNTDWLALSGLLLPPWLGIFLLAIKPQLGIGPALVWIYVAYRRGGLDGVLRTAGPLTVITMLSFFVFGFWPVGFQRALTTWWNASLWPWSIPFGLVALYFGLRWQRVEPGLIASPLLSPYVLLHSYSGALLAFVRKTKWQAIVVLAMWGWVLVRWFMISGGSSGP